MFFFFVFFCRPCLAFFSKITIKRQTILLVCKLLKQFWYLSSCGGQHVHRGLAWKSSLLDSSSWSHPTNTFHTLFAIWIYNSSKLDSISLNGNRLYWTRFSINGHYPSTCRIWVPAGTFFPPYPSHSVSSALTPSLQLTPSLHSLTTFLNSHTTLTLTTLSHK